MLAITTLLLLSFDLSSSYIVTVQPKGVECFFDKLGLGDNATLYYEISEGGNLDIDVTIKGPDDKLIYSKRQASDGRYKFRSSMAGAHHYCFSNEMSSFTEKVVLFELYIEEDDLKGAHNKLVEMTNDLADAIHDVKQEMEYMEVRENIHKRINESTNFRVCLWAAFEAFIVVVMSVGQVIYLKRFFEVRRMI